jgi:hypothetical protein
MTALAGEVSCSCGATILNQDGGALERERNQIVCPGCKDRYDAEMVKKAKDPVACVVMKRCAAGCEERMIKVVSAMGESPKMKCPECGEEAEFNRGNKRS